MKMAAWDFIDFGVAPRIELKSLAQMLRIAWIIAFRDVVYLLPFNSSQFLEYQRWYYPKFFKTNFNNNFYFITIYARNIKPQETMNMYQIKQSKPSCKQNYDQLGK